MPNLQEIEKSESTEDEVMEHIDIELTEKMSSDKHFAFGICKAAEIDEEERTVVAVISTGSIDRDGEVLDPKGVMLDNFVKNPVIPWSHNANEPPVGKALWIKKGTKRITAKAKFAITDRAEEVWQLFRGKFLNAFSVGFMPKKGHRPTPDEIKKNPVLADARFIYDEWELLEFSPVTVPANPEALATAVKSKSISLSKDLITELKIDVEAVGNAQILTEEEEKAVDVMIPVTEISEKKVSVLPIFDID